MAISYLAPSILAKIGVQWNNPSFPSSGGSPVVQAALGLAYGTAAGQFDTVIAASFTVANSGSPYTLNLNSGNKQADGLTAAAMARLLALIVINLSSVSGQTFSIGGGTHPVIAYAMALKANPNGTGSVFLFQQDDGGLAVAAGSTDTLTIATAAGTSVPGQLLAIGCSV